MARNDPFHPLADAVDPDERPSKTQRKKDSHELQDLGQALVETETVLNIHLGSSGKLAVTAEGGLAVLTENADTVISKWGSRGFGDDQFDLPHGVVFGPDGTVYVSDTQNQRVKAIAPNGKVLWTSGTARRAASAGASSTASPFSLPAGLTMDGAGRLVLVDPFGFKIFVLDSKTGKVLETYGEYGEADGFFAYPTGVDYDPGRDWFVVADTANNRLQILTIPGSGGNVGISASIFPIARMNIT